jgi:cytochrome c oxidase subunit 2
MLFILWVCAGTTAAVFGVMIYSIATFPKSDKSFPRAAATFRHSTVIEILWAIVPILILVGMAAPAVKAFVTADTRSEARFAVDSSDRDRG